jgi:hypothetical protein
MKSTPGHLGPHAAGYRLVLLVVFILAGGVSRGQGNPHSDRCTPNV